MAGSLPRNSTPLERALVAAWDGEADHPLKHLYNADACPAHLLPYLAWAWSVDRWNNDWPENSKRAACRAAWLIHQRKGTLGALRRVVEPLGHLLNVTEWFELDPPGPPGTFSLEVGVAEGGISDEMYQELLWLIDDAKPVSRHVVALSITLQTPGYLYLGAAVVDGDTLTIYPLETDVEP